MFYRNDNMLLRIAQADAFALAYEFVKDSDAPGLKESLLNFERYHQHPKYHKLAAGCYSDDTQMSLAVAEYLIKAHTDPAYIHDRVQGIDALNEQFTCEDFARYFYEAFKRDPRDGYSRGFQKILEESQSTKHMLTLIKPESNKNGAAMRAVPIGAMYDPHDVVSVAATQAKVTHDTYGGINSAVIVALMSHFGLHDRREFIEFKEWGLQYCPALEHFTRPWVGPVVGSKEASDPTGLGIGMNTAWAVHTLLCEESSLMGMMRRTIEWGGDTDSLAAIAWGIGSARLQNEELPQFLERDLEATGNPKFGPAYLKELGRRLMDAYDV